MLAELRLLLASCPQDATLDDYLRAVQDENCLGKRTMTTRKRSGKRLTELYALDPAVPLFRVMRRCWYADADGRPLLAVLLVLARDPLLRATAPAILPTQPGEELSRQALTEALSQAAGDRLNENTLETVVQRTASSWTQAGHLDGRVGKVRQRAIATPLTTAYALFVGHLSGARGMALFHTLWAQTLDAPFDRLVELAMEARRLGFLSMSHAGGVIDVSFAPLAAQSQGG